MVSPISFGYHTPAMIDSHAHLYYESFDADRGAVLQRAREAGIHGIINIGTDLDNCRTAIELARQYPGLFAAAGLHPTTPVEGLDGALAALRQLAAGNRREVVAIGEIGLDFHWKEVAPEAQRPKLLLQLDLARELRLPVIFHCRKAFTELLETLEARPSLPPGVFHCFAGGPEEARRALELGFHVSFCGNLTYPKAEALRKTAAAVPPEKILLETDSPFLPPQAKRGQRNEPAFVVHTRDQIARLHGLDPEEFGRLAEETTRKLFSLPPAG
ncbi:MAG: TatD family hydrolase [Planctomycetes bacterium]|nr:TatD family hydrolase [Planctomycetota bacterium]